MNPLTMKTIEILFFILVMTMNAPKLWGQFHGFEEGYVLLTAKDTLRGFVKPGRGASEKNEVQFKEKSESPIKTFSTETILGYFVAPSFYYEAIYRPPAQSGKKEFARKLVDAPAKIYTLSTAKGKIYILMKQNGKSVLIDRDDTSSEIEPAKNASFRGKLRYFMQDCPDLFSEIDAVSFHDADLTQLLVDYNYCLDSLQPIRKLYAKRPWSIDVGAHFSYHFASIKGENFQISRPRFNESTNYFTMGAAVSVGIVKNLTIRSGLTYATTGFQVIIDRPNSLELFDWQYDLSTVEIPLNFSYLIHHRIITPYIFLGGVWGFLLNGEVEEKWYFLGDLEAQTTTQLKADRFFGYQMGGGLTKQFSSLRINLELGYHHRSLTYPGINEEFIFNSFFAGILLSKKFE